MHGLGDDFARGEMARVAHLAGGAEDAAHRTTDLRTDAGGHPARVAHEDGFDFFRVIESEQVFAGEAVTRIGGQCGAEHTEPRRDGQAGAHLGGQCGHGGEGIDTFPVKIAPQPRDVHRTEFPAREERGEFRSGEVVEIDERDRHSGT